MDDLDPRLAEVARRFGRHALTDPVALRSALRQSGNAYSPAEIDALVAAASDPDRQPRTEVPLSEVPLSEVPLSDPEPTGPPLNPTLAENRLTWDGGPPTRQLPAKSRRGWIVAGAVLLAAAVTAGVLIFLPDKEETPAPPPDRYALDQVAGRYRALGARLLDGAVRCAQQPAKPGEVERVGCDAGLYALTLVTYDVPGRLTESRKLAKDAPALRSSGTDDEHAALTMSEFESGESRVYWDVDSPRPVSATLTSRKTGLPALVSFYDSRQFTVLKRPEVAGAAFASGTLWDFAQAHVLGEKSATCQAVPATTGTLERVKCPLADGAMLVFSKVADAEALTNLRAENAANGGVVPGSVEVRTWNRLGGPMVGQFIRFVTADDRSPTIYFDHDAKLVYGLFFGAPGSSPEALLERWQRGSAR